MPGNNSSSTPMTIFVAIAYFAFSVIRPVQACTNLLVTKEASIDGSNIISYNADASNFYATIYHYPAGKHTNDTMRKIWDWDYGNYLGEIPEISYTYNVVGNANEHGLIITESTFGGLKRLAGSKDTGVVDYGSLIWITLQRAKTAREAITIMDGLVNTYGYASTGESFSIADQNEIWYLEMIGKGNFELGAVWVARKVPGGYVTGHANQARITNFPLDDSDNCLFSADVISFAREIGLYKGSDSEFSFSDVYDPVTFFGARFCEARVWSFFSFLMGATWSGQYLDYAQGYNLTNRMPLWVKPTVKLNAQDVMKSMRNHYEGTALDMTGTEFSDVGAGAFHGPQRVAPNQWSLNKIQYLNERPIATMVSGWNIVCETRSNMPRELAALMWYGMDDSSTSVHIPVYGSVTSLPRGWAGPGPQDGVAGPMMKFSLDSAFYVFNLVSNFVYSRWADMYPELHDIIIRTETKYANEVVSTDKKALDIYDAEGPAAAVEYVTKFTVVTGDNLLKDWFEVFGHFFVKYRDGYKTVPAPEDGVCGCKTVDLSYDNQWYGRIVDDTGDHYLVPQKRFDVVNSKDNQWVPIPKQELRSLR